MPHKTPALATAIGLCGLLCACASAPRAAVVQTTPVPPPLVVAPAQPDPQPDPVAALIETSEAQFAIGRQDLALGHLDHGRRAFDAAIDTLLESPTGARGDARLREELDALIDRISALEQGARATGDGFTETASAPAVIDTLLADGGADTAPPALATAEVVAADLRRTAHDIPIPVNQRVLKYVEVFQGRLREFLTDGLARGSQYLPMIQDVFRAEGLPQDLAYVPLIESAFNPTALSRSKARGVWQFMRDTGLENGLKSDWYLDERADPVKATAAAAKYLKTLYGIFDDWHLAMASYNGGPGLVQRAVARSHKNDFWDLSASPRYLPRETRDYVPMILAAVIIARNPTQYGFDVTPTVPAPSETVPVPPALDLRRVAEWAGVSINEIQGLNPELRRWTTPIRPGEYTLRVPAGTADRVREGLSQAPPAGLNALQWYTVKPGDSVVTVARKLGVSRTDLSEANYLKRTARVSPGQKLLVPRMPSAALLAKASGADVALVEMASAAPASSRPAAATGDERTRTTYRVRPGDTLTAIARRYGTTVEQLKTWNNLRDARLNVGDRLVLMASTATNTQQN